MSTAIIQGATGGIGLPLTRWLLASTSLNVVAMTSKSSSHVSDIRSQLLANTGDASKAYSRLEIVPDVDLLKESSIKSASERVQEKLREFGKLSSGGREGVKEEKDARLLVCLSGVLTPEKSIAQIDADHSGEMFARNIIGHLLFYKHFVPLVPTATEMKKLSSGWESDPANGHIRGDDSPSSLIVSLSARVGSIGDNEKGGWYSYRASKAALNQVIRCLDLELQMKKSSALAMAYHPGTVLTPFTKPILGDKAKPDESKGLLTPDQAAEKLMNVMKSARRADNKSEDYGGRFFDWKGDRVPW